MSKRILVIPFTPALDASRPTSPIAHAPVQSYAVGVSPSGPAA